MLNFKINKIHPVILYSLEIIYLEIILKIFTCKSFFNIGLLFMPVFSIVTGMIIHILCLLFKRFKAKKVSAVILFIFCFIFATQSIYQRFFNKFFIIFSVISGGVGQVLSGKIATSTFEAILKAIPIILLLLIPFVLHIIFYDKVVLKEQKKHEGLIHIGSALGVHAIAVLIISLIPAVSSTQSGLFDTDTSVSIFGLLRTEVLDIKYNLLGVNQELNLEEEGAVSTITPITDKNLFNVSDIDFDALYNSETDETLKVMNGYFAEKEPTAKNEYTGMYEGYNLISIVAEGFSPYVIDEELTPTLYKMQQEGFNFTNFYTPIWDVSTSDGEYTVCTGLIPKSGVWSFYSSRENYMPYCLGNMFKSIGVDPVYAYHNNSATYYHRHLSHPNIGYDFKALGSGVEEYVQNLWPQSDLEMITGSLPEYLSTDKQFHAYYMTVSGHLKYDYESNAMTQKNWDMVKDLDCNDTLKAYYACNIELDKAMEKLLFELNEAGVADKTVITITPDHYPYGLEKDYGDIYENWSEILGHEVETEFELYKSCFLIYCQGTENEPTVDKVCYSADVLPTILNLFGFEYDSRLLVGKDILSDSPGLVIMSDKSFMTDLGKYDAIADEFTVFDKNTFKNEEEKEEYFENMMAQVNNTFKISSRILEEDYYRYVFKK